MPDRIVTNILSTAAVVAAAACGGSPSTEARRPTADVAPPVKLLTARFEPRAIRRIEVGDFHFTAGQLAPIHTHPAPVLGYVSKGSIIYQVEGQSKQVLVAGDAFFEPVGPRILHFDNASQTEEAVFTDFNFERTGEPFIQFPEPPVNLKVDRRTFPTVEVANASDVGRIDVFAQTIEPSASVRRPANPLPVMGYVASGTIDVGGTPVTVGHSFAVPAGSPDVALTNHANTAAKIVTFEPVL